MLEDVVMTMGRIEGWKEELKMEGKYEGGLTHTTPQEKVLEWTEAGSGGTPLRLRTLIDGLVSWHR
jgi:hypothetical protein